MNYHVYILSAIAIMAIITFMLRAIPFILLKKKRFKFIDYLGFMMPPGIMIILVIFSMLPPKDSSIYYFVNISLAGFSVIILHHLFRNSLISISVGTGIYIMLSYWEESLFSPFINFAL